MKRNENSRDYKEIEWYKVSLEKRVWEFIKVGIERREISTYYHSIHLRGCNCTQS